MSDPTALQGVLVARNVERAWVQVDLDSGRALGTVAAPDAEWIVGASTHELALASTSGGAVVAIDLALRREAWRTSCTDMPSIRCRLHGARQGTIVALAGTLEFNNPRMSSGVIVLDTRDGRVLWRLLIAGFSGDDARVVIDEARVYVYDGRGVWAFDRDTGKPRWSLIDDDAGGMPHAELPLAVGASRVAFATDFNRKIHLVEARNGKVVRTLEVANSVGRLAFVDDTLVAVASSGFDALALATFDARTGAARVECTAAERLADNETFHIAGAALDHGVAFLPFIAGNGERSDTKMPDEIHAIDLATGHLLWTHALGRAMAVALVTRGDRPPLIVAQISKTETLALEPGRADTDHDVEIRGALRSEYSATAVVFSGVRLRVAGKPTITDANGNYRVSLKARGAVPIVVSDDLDRFRPYAIAIMRPLPAFAYVDGAKATLDVDVVVEIHEPK